MSPDGCVGGGQWTAVVNAAPDDSPHSNAMASDEGRERLAVLEDVVHRNVLEALSADSKSGIMHVDATSSRASYVNTKAATAHVETTSRRASYVNTKTATADVETTSGSASHKKADTNRTYVDMNLRNALYVKTDKGLETAGYTDMSGSRQKRGSVLHAAVSQSKISREDPTHASALDPGACAVSLTDDRARLGSVHDYQNTQVYGYTNTRAHSYPNILFKDYQNTRGEGQRAGEPNVYVVMKRPTPVGTYDKPHIYVNPQEDFRPYATLTQTPPCHLPVKADR